MYIREVVIKNPTGLHARPATGLVNLVKKLDARIELVKGEEHIDPRSIINLLTSDLKQGTSVRVCAESDDDSCAVDTVCNYIESLKE